MIREQLEAYHDLMVQLITKETQIKNLRKYAGGLKSPSLEGMPYGSGISDKTGNAAVEIADLEERLKFQIQRAKELKPPIEEFINSIDDDVTRLIFKFRVLYGYSWSDVAEAMGGYNTKGSVRARYRNFLDRIEPRPETEDEENEKETA